MVGSAGDFKDQDKNEWKLIAFFLGLFGIPLIVGFVIYLLSHKP